jgi:hypothetical protein
MGKINIFLLLIFVFMVLAVKGQELQFDYDASGNCVLKYRTIVVQPQNRVPESPQTEELGKSRLTVFPNPTDGILNVLIGGEMPSQPVSVMLSDMNGKILQNFTTTSLEFNIDITSYPRGSYMLLMIVNNRQTHWKIIKK